MVSHLAVKLLLIVQINPLASAAVSLDHALV